MTAAIIGAIVGVAIAAVLLLALAVCRSATLGEAWRLDADGHYRRRA